jgi:hypothetical protein
MTVGTLVHSEIWNNLMKFRPDRADHERLFDIICGIDSIFREAAQKTQNRRDKKSSGTDGLRSLVEERRREMERGTKAG